MKKNLFNHLCSSEVIVCSELMKFISIQNFKKKQKRNDQMIRLMKLAVLKELQPQSYQTDALFSRN